MDNGAFQISPLGTAPSNKLSLHIPENSEMYSELDPFQANLIYHHAASEMPPVCIDMTISLGILS